MKKSSFIYGMLTGAAGVLLVVLLVCSARQIVNIYSGNSLSGRSSVDASDEDLEISDEVVQKKLDLIEKYIDRFYLDTTSQGLNGLFVLF